MKVQDNLENYEIPYKYRLTIEEEEELAKDVAEIIPELEKRRTSKVQTRKYFKQHLRYTSNVRAKNMAEGKDEAKYEEDEDYTPLEGEYTWASDLLQPVLLDVLSVERFKYGYIVNLLENDILSRGTLRYKNAWTVSGNLVQFSNEFDIDAIREEVAKIEDIRKRIVYLQTKKADLQVTDLLTISEKQDWGPEYDDKIDALIALEEKRLELYPSGYERTAPAPVTVPAKSESRDLFKIVYDYCDKDDQVSDKAYTLLLKAVNIENSTVDRSVVEEMFTFVDNCFAHFLDSCELLTHDKIGDIFTFTDHWYEHFKEAIDDANTRCQQSIKVSVQKKQTSQKREVLNKIALTYANFIIEKAVTVVSGFKANILYNHRYETEVYYNIYDDPLEAYFAERDRLEGKFGAGQERDIYFDMNTNIDAFYDKATRLIHDGLIEATLSPDTFEEDDETSQYKDKVRALIEQGLPFYVEFMKLTHSLNSEAYHEASSWIETTRYCLGSVILAAELWTACDEKRSALVNYSLFQQFNIEFLPKLLDENLLKYKSDTGDYDIDDKLNDLGERDADEWDYAVPAFDNEVLTDTFITKAEIDDAIRNDPSRLFSINNILTGEEAEAYLEKLDSEENDKKVSASQDDTIHILLSGKEDDVKTYITEHLDKSNPTKSICLLIAARDLGITGKLTYSVAIRMFGKFASRSTFNTYYNGGRGVDLSVVSTYKTALTQLFLTSKSGPE